MPVSPAVPDRVLLILAHPDDAEFICGGTVALWARAGAAIRFVLVTSGDAGSIEPGMTRERLAAIREAEQRAAAAALGVTDIVFLRHHDGEVVADLALRRELVREIRRFRPDTLVTFDPSNLYAGPGYINHPDHRAVGQASLDAAFPAAGMPLNFAELEAEGLQAHRVRRVLLFLPQSPNAWVEISETLDAKVAAVREHVCQLGGHDPAGGLHQEAAEAAGPVGLRYAEAFRQILIG